MKYATKPLKSEFSTPLGPMTAAVSDTGLLGLWFGDQKHLPEYADWPVGSNALLTRTGQQLADYFAKKRNTFDLPLDLSAGTAFQQSVWQALLQIPCGASVSYGDIAVQIGNRTAVRAVGAAVGRNPVGIIVPCHRVLGRDGSLTGYAGGLERKIALLQLEGVLLG